MSWRAPLPYNSNTPPGVPSPAVKKSGNLWVQASGYGSILLHGRRTETAEGRCNTQPRNTSGGGAERPCPPLHTVFLVARFEIGHTQRKTRPELAATSRVIAYRAVSNRGDGAAKKRQFTRLPQSRPIIIHHPTAECKGFFKKNQVFLKKGDPRETQ